jgi:hypothetical protein
MGMSNMLGASFKFDAENSISLGGGIRGKYLYEIDPRVHILTLQLVPTGGVFWDKNNSLMASITASGQEDQTVIMNLYPGIFNIPVVDLTPALWLAYGTNGTYGVGIAFQQTFGVGYRNK